MAVDPWEKEQIKAILAEDRRRAACERKAIRAAAALLKAYDEQGVTTDVLKVSLAAVHAVAEQLGLVKEKPKHKPGRKQIGRGLARAVWDRDGWTCQRCGSHTDLTVDHKHPVSRGGTNDLSNLQTLCGRCNSSKGAKV